ncbi:unnamed protein product [Rotaria magnacalcarata]|uniref:Uncharacterized protein n=1 Tax=Rotaria magnacalcarata TaxID=392030 RepID=A0A815GWX8_9BILA|nr:unnamed protein product [Rotaria magnacalcarata]
MDLTSYMSLLTNSEIKNKHILTKMGEQVLMLPEHQLLHEKLKTKYPERFLRNNSIQDQKSNSYSQIKITNNQEAISNHIMIESNLPFNTSSYPTDQLSVIAEINNIENNIQSNFIYPILNGTIVSDQNITNLEEVRDSTSFMNKNLPISPVTNILSATSEMVERIHGDSSNINDRNQYQSTVSNETNSPCTTINSFSISNNSNITNDNQNLHNSNGIVTHFVNNFLT